MNDQRMMMKKQFFESLSPTAWTHILLLGFFQFFNEPPEDWVQDCLYQWDWKNNADEIANKKMKKNARGSRKKK